ncbi:hypothetical protein GCM10009784_18100 [Arthrobacter parietis]|uniref:GH16 domain-containing protein n=1 Tax=Arthrobacter parietis TaxID=271434 RepID=A0ABN3AVP4_9MICC
MKVHYPRIRPLTAAAAAVVVVLAVSAVPGASAADNSTMTTDPGPAGDFTWEGYNWLKRSWTGGPHYNGSFDPANVSGPDANGKVSLALTNPSGNAPVAAEFQSTRRGFGYGTYSAVVERNLQTLQKEVVWGCMFTYDPDSAPGHNEIDVCEASAWGGGAAWGESRPVRQGHGYWFDATKPAGTGSTVVNFDVTPDPVLTHRLVWEPGRLTYETFAGEGYSGTLLKRTVLEGATVPVPAREAVHFNLWVTGGGGGYPNQVRPEQVTVRDFSFTPRAAEPTLPAIPLAPAPTITGTAKVGQRLTANPGSWSTGTALTYQWYRAGTPIRGATAKTYTVLKADRHSALTVAVTGSKAGYASATRVSAPTARVR